MKGTKEESVEITLKMTGEEAIWLKSVMQNPLGGCAPKDEADNEKGMRTMFWNVLSSLLN